MCQLGRSSCPPRTTLHTHTLLPAHAPPLPPCPPLGRSPALQKLLAFEKFLEEHPEWRDKVGGLVSAGFPCLAALNACLEALVPGRARSAAARAPATLHFPRLNGTAAPGPPARRCCLCRLRCPAGQTCPSTSGCAGAGWPGGLAMHASHARSLRVGAWLALPPPQAAGTVGRCCRAPAVFRLGLCWPHCCVAPPSASTHRPRSLLCRSMVHEVVGRINGQYGTLTHVPIYHLDR